MNITTKALQILAPTAFGLAIFASYAAVAREEPPRAFIDLILQSFGKENLLIISEFLNPRGLVHFISTIAALPLAIGLSLTWILISKKFDSIKSKISLSIFVSLMPFTAIYFLFFYINLKSYEIGFINSLSNYGFGYWSDTLAAVFLPYYILLLVFKLALIREGSSS